MTRLTHIDDQGRARMVDVSDKAETVREAIEGYAAELTKNLPDWDATAARLRAEHRAILDAVNTGDGGRAARLVAAHIEGYYREAGLPASG